MTMRAPVRAVLAGRARRMGRLFADDDPARAQRAMQARFGMRKLDIAALRNAADGVTAA